MLRLIYSLLYKQHISCLQANLSLKIIYIADFEPKTDFECLEEEPLYCGEGPTI